MSNIEKFLFKISFGLLLTPSLFAQTQMPSSSTPNPAASKRLDSAGLKGSDNLKKPDELKASNPKSKKETLTSTELSNEDPSKLEKQIKAIQLILRNEKDRNKKINLYLRLSYLHVSIAKKYGVKRVKGEKISSVEAKHLDEAEKILSFLLKNVENNKRMLSTLYNIKGLVSYELDQPEKTVENFLKSIELNPKNSQAEVMSIFIGEYYFEIEKYDDAIKFYQMFYVRMNKTQKALSDYKVAWSYLNKKEIDKAELQFIKIIKEQHDRGIAEDSFKDLAFILTQNKDESVLISKVNGFLTHPGLKGRLYYYCLLFYLQNSKGEPKDLLFKEVLGIQKDPLEVLKIMSLKVSFEKKDIPSPSMVNAVFSLDKRLSVVKKEVKEEFFKKEAFQLEEDSEFNIRTHIDAYAGRLKTEDNIPKLQLGELAVRLIGIHMTWFPQSKRRVLLYHLWIDTCVDLKNSSCLFNLETRFKNEKETSETREFLKKIQIEILALYDEAYEKDKVKHQAAFVGRLKTFIQSFPNDPLSLKSQKRLFGILYTEKKYAEALPIGEAIFNEEKTVDNVQKILLIFFELQRYSDVQSHPVYSGFISAEITEIKREASLKSAMLNSNAGNFQNYENDIKAYLKTNPSEEKSAVVYSDYFKKLVELGQFAKLEQEWKGLAPTIKTRPAFASIRSQFFDQSLNTGDLYHFPEFWVYGNDKNANYQILINRTIHNQKLTTGDLAELEKQEQDKRLYLLNIVSYTDPEMVYSYLYTRPKLSSEEKRLAYSSLLLASKQLSPIFSADQIKPFKELVSDTLLEDKEVPIEKNFKNVIFPNSKMSAKTYESYVVNNVDNVKFLRNKVLKAVTSATAKQKVRLLEKMAETEAKMADSIRNSPPPAGLSSAQLAEYQNGLGEMAKEYDNQSGNFKKAKVEIETKLSKDAEEEKSRLLPLKTAEGWTVNHNENFKKLKDIYEKLSVKASIIYLDNLLSSKKIDPVEYYSLKTWVLFKFGMSDAHRKIYRSELESMGQQSLVDKWKAL
ncbi:MAG: hypothetical protein JNL11_16810 [Bdellovibrionaceae bacterium]|nr:hypothetical protein [Pseudobdellovibrionaceae bacterium]